MADDREFSSFDESAWKEQNAADDREIARLLEQSQDGTSGGLKLDDTPFDQTNKADDAEDFEDISDDDLPEEELPSVGTSLELPNLTDDGGTSHDPDDLFGEGPSSPTEPGPEAASPAAHVHHHHHVGDADAHTDADLEAKAEFQQTRAKTANARDANADADAHAGTGTGTSTGTGAGANANSNADIGPDADADVGADADVDEPMIPTDSGLSFGSINFDPDPHLNGAANQDPDIPAPAESVEDLLKAAWPAFRRGHILTWSELLPPKKATWKEKKPLKRPKHLVTSKLSLDLAPDGEKQFRIPGPASSASKLKRRSLTGLVFCDELDRDDEELRQFELDPDSDNDTVNGFTLHDIELVCQDWSTQIDAVEEEFMARRAAEQEEALPKRRRLESAEQDDEWDAEFLMDTDEPQQQPRTQTRRPVKSGLPEIPRYTAPSFDNFEDATRRGAKRVNLDVDDPRLLLESETSQPKKRPRQDAKENRMANGSMGRDLSQRFNISNDEAYDLLKENHQSKVRATLGNISVEHAMPSIRLAWPYYKVKLGGTTDEYHRPRFRYRKVVGQTVRFEKPLHFKRKQMKGKAHEVFLKSKDLSMCDNSTAVLFEYCEPRPRVLNNFGMGNKLINYYRRKENIGEDQLPKLDLGEYRTLLPEDRSPFSLFGTVDPGETVPTLHNEMYRAPVFRHTPRTTDFLVVRNTTGIHGSKWYLHKIDHLHVVGQTFPSVDVPGPHSRRVTNASKNRMKMLAFRMIRHSRGSNCQLSDITKHIAESTDTQNRQKLKEFLQYDRDSNEKGMWRLKQGDVLPDEIAIRAMIKPEEVSLLDAMQLGIKELEDAGYDPRNATIDEDQPFEAEEEDEDDEGSKIVKGNKKTIEKQEETLADKMAPWKTTKAFIDACAQKAMLQLHGEGDPTGHGLGFSFIRTSMKGGYIEAVQGPLATSADAMEREKRANGGHAYNVKRQQAMYEEGIREIWEKQRTTLSDRQEHDDRDIVVTEDEDDRFNVQSAPTPALFDEGASQISGLTSASRHPKRAIRITREVQMPDGTTQTRIEVVHDPVVISQYIKRRTEADLEMRDIYSSRPTGNADHDRLTNLRIKKELERLEKNKARRQAREQQKELHQKASTGDAGSPSADKIQAGTSRKCANCGQVGHIKTNKKLCPLLNGTMKADNGAAEHGGFGNYNAPTTSAGSPV